MYKYVTVICSHKPIQQLKFPSKTNELHLDYTSISSVSPGTFENLFNITFLNLSGNFISELHDSTFQNNRNLETLDLSYNMIRNLPVSLFCNLLNLQHLNLQNNKIHSLPGLLFQHQRNLTNLLLSRNELVTLKRSVLEPLVKLEYLQLSENSFRCDCDLVGARDWLVTHNLSVNVECEISQNKSLVNWSNLNVSDVCSYESMTHSIDESIASKQWFIITISVLVVTVCLCFILAVIWWRHKSRNCPSTLHKIHEPQESNENANNVIDIDQLYAKVNKSRDKIAKTNSNLKNPKLERVGFYASLKDESLYCEPGSEGNQTGSQVFVKNSIYEPCSENFGTI